MKFMKRFKTRRPKRHQLCGLSPSELKTLLKRNGFKIKRTFFKYGCIATKNNRLFRFRYWDKIEFKVDISCVKNKFDYWANSIEEIVLFNDFLNTHLSSQCGSLSLLNK